MFKIRLATIDDYQQICEVFADGDEHHLRALPNVFQCPDGPVRAWDYIYSIIADAENSAIFVAEDQNEIVGLVQIIMRSTLDVPIIIPQRFAMVENLVVSRDHRRHGIGRMLIDAAHEWALDRGAARIALNVWEFNEDAIAFYDELGYQSMSRVMWRTLKEDG